MDHTPAQGILSWCWGDNWKWINATYKELGQKSLKVLGIHYLTGSNITSCFYGKKDKESALTALKEPEIIITRNYLNHSKTHRI